MTTADLISPSHREIAVNLAYLISAILFVVVIWLRHFGFDESLEFAWVSRGSNDGR